MDVSQIAAILILAPLCLASVLLTAVRLPGTWVLLVVAAGYGWLTGWDPLSGIWLGVLAAAAVVGEIVENLASMLLARRVGASRRASWGGLIGGFLGLLIFTIPLPVIGSTIGAIIGCFVGAMIGELTRPMDASAMASATRRGELARGGRVGFFSAIGFVLGIIAKTLIAFAMSGLLIGLAAKALVA